MGVGKITVGFALAAMCATSSAWAQQAELEYPNGSLAYQAILANDLAAAEQKLQTNGRIRRDDPARLLNHGYVLAKTGRLNEAAKLFRMAEKMAAVELVLADGRTISSRHAAKLALQRVSVGGPDSE